MVEMSKTVPDCNNQSIQHFISNSLWDQEFGSLHLDESGFPKQGENSAGVNRQYCGRLGKIDNCQVGVFLGYVNDSKRVLFDKRLYIPKDWMNDTVRKKKCGIPDDLIFKTKAELGIPQKNGIRGRNPTIEKVISSDDPLRVDKLVNDLDSSQWHRVYLRDSERKEMWCNLACLRVYPVNDSLPGKECWLIIRKNEGESDTKYQFSNASLETSIEKLGKMSCSRYWIERALEDAKGDGGLADYEVRGYIGWNHHMAMVFMAMLFLLEMQDEWKLKAPLLTLTDVREIFEVIMPKRRVNDKEILKLIEQKHKARYSAKLSHHKKGR
jgi:SRSO17 transposase